MNLKNKLNTQEKNIFQTLLNWSIFGLMLYPLLMMYITNPLINLPYGSLISQGLFLGLPMLILVILFFFKNEETFYNLKNIRGLYIVGFLIITLITHGLLYSYKKESFDVLFNFSLLSTSIGLIMANIRYPRRFLDWFFSKRWLIILLIALYVFLGFRYFQRHYSIQGQTISFLTSFIFFFITSYNLSFHRKKTFLNFVEPLLLVLLLVVMASRITLFIAGVIYCIYLFLLLKDDIFKVTHKYKKISITIMTFLSLLTISFIVFFRQIFTFINTELNKRGIFIRIFRLAASGEIFYTSGRNDIIYPVAVRLIQENPFIGHGIGKVRYETTQNYIDKLNIAPENAQKISVTSLYPHNFLLELGSVFGILLTAVLLFYYLKLAYKAYKSEIKSFVIIFSLGYIIMLSFVSSIFDFKYLWFFIGLMSNYAINTFTKNNK